MGMDSPVMDGFIDRRIAFDDDAVRRHPLAGPHQDEVARPDLLDRGPATSWPSLNTVAVSGLRVISDAMSRPVRRMAYSSRCR